MGCRSVRQPAFSSRQEQAAIMAEPPNQKAVANGLCAHCPLYPSFLEAGRCQPGEACIRAHSGRQIDRFLRRNPDEAEHYLDDIFWERRAIAARHAPVDRIFRLKRDRKSVV